MRQAVVVIHGIGEQKPMETIRSFVDSIIEDEPQNKKSEKPKFWNKPERISDLYELRRYTVPQEGQRPITEFYEYYWAYMMKDTNIFQVLSWIGKLLWKNPRNVPKRFIIGWGLIWLLLILAVYSFLTGLLPILQVKEYYNENIIFAALIGILLWIINYFVLRYAGDAARYLSSNADNVEIRHQIKAKGIEVLKNLHRTKNYDRIILVGHSLGSVIGYDIIKHLWTEYNKEHGNPLKCRPKSIGPIQQKSPVYK